MSLEHDITEIMEVDIFKPASEEEIKGRKIKSRELDAIDSIVQVKVRRRCNVCSSELSASEKYLKVNTPGSYAGATVCKFCVHVAARELAKEE